MVMDLKRKLLPWNYIKNGKKKIKETLMIGVMKPIMICFGSKDMEMSGKNLKKSLKLK